MNATVAEVFHELKKLAVEIGVPVNDDPVNNATGSYEREINFFPDAKSAQAWVNRADNNRGGKSSIGINLLNGKLTYGYADFKHDRSRIFRRPF